MELADFGLALLIALPVYLLLSITVMVLIKMMGFSQPSVFRMSMKYFSRWVGISLFAAFLTMYLSAQEMGTGEFSYYVALFFGLGTGALALVVLDILSVRAED